MIDQVKVEAMAPVPTARVRGPGMARERERVRGPATETATERATGQETVTAKEMATGMDFRLRLHLRLGLRLRNRHRHPDLARHRCLPDHRSPERPDR